MAQIGEQAQSLDIDVDITEASSAIQCKLSRSTQDILGLTYMQALTPTLAAGGHAEMDVNSGTLQQSFGAVYDDGPNVAVGTWDSEVSISINIAPTDVISTVGF